jgi:hypothetical protein
LTKRKPAKPFSDLFSFLSTGLNSGLWRVFMDYYGLRLADLAVLVSKWRHDKKPY